MPLASLALPLLLALPLSPSDDIAPPPIEKEAVIAAPRAKVWAAWTTVDGVTSFFAPDASVELRLGGPYEMYFKTDEPEGSRGSEGCRILSFLPERMLSFTWNAPPLFPAERTQRTFVVVELVDADGGAGTRVKLTHSGFGAGGRWAEVRGYFDAAWGSVLKHLAERFSPSGPRFKPVSPPKTTAPRTYFVSFLRPKDMAALANPTAEGRAAFEGHVAHLRSLQARGRLVLAGPSLLPGGGDATPFGGPAIGLVVFSAKDEAEAKSIAEADPMVKAGLFEMTLRPFELSFERP